MIIPYFTLIVNIIWEDFMDKNKEPALYGIINSNRKAQDFWGKNMLTPKNLSQ